jgi:uncharacterized alpha-E superfamily protein
VIGTMLLSRVADSMYWIARYLERAEHTARLIDVRVDLGLGRQGSGEWDFARLYASLKLGWPKEPPANPAALLGAAVFDLADRNSVVSCVTAARENARQAREEISSEMWEQINGLHLRLRQVAADGLWAARPHYALRMIIDGVHLFQGITDATMAHGEGWHFMRAGRFLERAASTAALLAPHFTDETIRSGGMIGNSDHIEWVGLLRSCSGFEAYCRQYTADLNPVRIAEFLLLNAEFPRSVRFSAARIESALRAMGHVGGRGSDGRAERLAGRLHASLDYAQVDEILSDDPAAYLDGIARECAQVHNALHQTYVVYPIETALPA